MNFESDYDLVIVGGGPCALLLITNLQYRNPNWFACNSASCPSSSSNSSNLFQPKIAVFDKQGTWLSNWKALFKKHQIERLRSPATFHCDASEADGLLVYACENKKCCELTSVDDLLHSKVKRRTGNRGRNFIPSDVQRLQIPSTKLFNEHIDHLVESGNLSNLVHQASVTKIEVMQQNCPKFRIHFLNRPSCIASIVVVATGGTNQPLIPQVFKENKSAMSSGIVIHAYDKNLTYEKPKLSDKNEFSRLLVVGGGITAAQLAINACRENSYDEVVMVIRDKVIERHFDVPLEWVGRWRMKLLSDFLKITDFDERWKLIRDVRTGGSIPRFYVDQLDKFKKEGKLIIMEQTELTKVQVNDPLESLMVEMKIADSGIQTDKFHRIFLATGSELNVRNESCFSDILMSHPVDLIEGRIPKLTEHLRLNEKIPLYVIGCYSCLRIGPAAFNLNGGLLCSQRVTPCIEEQLKQLNRCASRFKANNENEARQQPARTSEFEGVLRKVIGHGSGLYDLLNEVEA